MQHERYLPIGHYKGVLPFSYLSSVTLLCSGLLSPDSSSTFIFLTLPFHTLSSAFKHLQIPLPHPPQLPRLILVPECVHPTSLARAVAHVPHPSSLARGRKASGFEFGAVVDVVSDGEFSWW